MTASSCARLPCSASQNTGSSASVPTPAAAPPLASRSSATATSDSSGGTTVSARGSVRHGTKTAAQTIATDKAAAERVSGPVDAVPDRGEREAQQRRRGKRRELAYEPTIESHRLAYRRDARKLEQVFDQDSAGRPSIDSRLCACS